MIANTFGFLNEAAFTPRYMDDILLWAVQDEDEIGTIAWLDAGGNINAVDRNGSTPLSLAVAMGNIRIASLLLDRGADVNVRDHGGRTTLMRAALGGQIHLTKQLIERGVDVNAQSMTGETALMHACYRGDHRMIDFLLSHGANLELADSLGRTAIFHAVHAGYSSTLLWLMDRGANVNALDGDGKSILTWFLIHSQYERPNVVRILLDVGINRHVVDVHGISALEVAQQKGYGCIVELLSRI